MSRVLTREDLARISAVAPRFRKVANLVAFGLFVLGWVVGHRLWQFEGLRVGRYWVGALALAALGRFAVMPYACLWYLRCFGIELSVSELDVLTVADP